MKSCWSVISSACARARSLRLVHLGLALALLFASLADTNPLMAQSTSVPTAREVAEEPCLSGDPFALEELHSFLSSDDPPRGPQEVNRYTTVEFVGKGVISDTLPIASLPREDVQDPPSTAPEPPREEALYREMQLSVFNTRTQNEFHLVMKQAMLDTILDCHEATGRVYATDGFDTLEEAERLRTLFLPVTLQGSIGRTTASAPPVMRPAGWSNGVDTRILRTFTTAWPWRTISQFRYGGTDESRCTGTLIGPRHLITAAHCINQQGTNTWFTIRVAPGKNGVGVEPYGSSVIKINPDPGTEAWYFTPWQWRSPTHTHWQWDWGLIVIPNRLGNQTGWMGYVAVTGAHLKSVSNYNRGYPLCNTNRNNQPANCQDSRLYGDTNLCSIGNFFNPGPDGWNRRISVSCDMSAGHSGSAVYHYFYVNSINKWVPVVSMVASTESCTTCGPLDFYPNTMRRITPGDLGVISWLRETFP